MSRAGCTVKPMHDLRPLPVLAQGPALTGALFAIEEAIRVFR
jgi:hypothetical protein